MAENIDIFIMRGDERMKQISIVVPCYNSSGTITSVVEQIQSVFSENRQYDVQLILVNDCSPDNTFGVIKGLCQRYNNIIGVDLSRNYGQASARMAGMRYVTGDFIICMDDDGQHPVEGIMELISALENGADVVYVHFVTKQTSIFKKITSSITRKIYEMIGIIPSGIYVSSFFAIHGKYKEQLQLYKSPYPSVGTYLFQYTTRFVNINMNQAKRITGKSGYRIRKLFNLFFNSITNFSIVPVRFILGIGLCGVVLSFIWLLLMLICSIFASPLANGFTVLGGILVFICNILLSAMGLVGEYAIRTYVTLSGKPQFSIGSTIYSDKIKEEIQNELFYK